MLLGKSTAFFLKVVPFILPLVCHAANNASHRVVVYYQSAANASGVHVPLLPLVNSSKSISVTNVLISAIHIVDDGDKAALHLNDYPPADSRYDQIWSDVAQLQAKGVAVSAMVGGAAVGSWPRLDGNTTQFEKYYKVLHDFVGAYNLQGLDLDVEQSMSLEGIIRLIDRLKADFGKKFIISLAPVGAALQKTGGNLSGFSYFDLEKQRGSSVDFYNAQFYFGWGDASSTTDYQNIVSSGFPAKKVTMGLLTNPANGNSGFVPLDKQAPVIKALVKKYPDFGGVAGWEYFNSLPSGQGAPWEWAAFMAQQMRGGSKKLSK